MDLQRQCREMRERNERKRMMSRLRDIHRRVKKLEDEAFQLEEAIGPIGRRPPKLAEHLDENQVRALTQVESSVRAFRIRRLAVKIGCSPDSIYNWLRRNSIAWASRQRGYCER
jgi:hypothetical protein